MKKLSAAVVTLALLLCLLFCQSASADIGDLIRFLPTTITVSTNKVVVEGYFVNLNQDVTVSNFTDFEMNVYLSGDLLVEGSFGTINSFSISPLRTKYQSFTFNGAHDLNNGTYTCNDNFYTAFSCNFKSSK